jgi:GntR family transcriptional regulator, galactonate operon transcriptional repressor
MARFLKHAGAAAQRARLGSQRLAAERADRRDRAAQRFERNIHTALAGKLGREIVGGTYPPGSLLPNAADMCARFSVSRTALREAYSVLAAKAMIVARPKIGTRVRAKADWNMLDPEVLSWHLQTTPTEAFVAELFVLRKMVEPEAAALAAGAHSRATVDRIGDAYRRMEQFKDGAGDLIGADLDFHMGILEATGNHFLTALGGLIRTSLECTFELSWEGASKIQDDRLHQHRGILEAIRDGLPELARIRMTELLSDSVNDVRQYLKQRDGAGEAAPARRDAGHAL